MPTVLVVEDHDNLRDGLVELLRSEGIGVEAAADGAAALAVLRAGLRPCVIVLDLDMPVMDGYQFRREQIVDPELRAIPVIVLSATADAMEFLGGITADAYVQKPTDFATLMVAIRQHCSR
jgi:CheY-like chemotaxis protein